MAIDLNNPFELTVSQAVVTLDASDSRFEAFCRDAISVLEGGGRILSTSTSWDLGRDGVGAGAASGIYVCASLRDDVDIKALNDLLRLASTTRRISRVYFCSSRKLTEHRITQLENQLSDEIDHAYEIRCFGATQLTEIVKGTPIVLERHYGAEIRDALRAISTEPSDEVEIHGLRLALIAAAGDDSIQIRRELYRAALLEILCDKERRTLAMCAKQVSEKLRLGHSVAEAVFAPHVRQLVEEKLVVPVDSTFRITDAGIKCWEELRISAAERFLGGRNAIREVLQQSIGSKIGDDDYARIWAIFEERIATHFHTRGAQLVAEVAAILDESPTDDGAGLGGQLSFVEELATAVASTASHPNRRSELHQATLDLFTDRTSAASEWLVRVCASYLACCALGLEHTSGAALGRLLSRTALVLDSDVVLSLLGEGEPEHDSVFTIVSKWTRIGGKIFVAEPVLEEVAYHAHIAPRDYEQVRHLLPGTANDRLRIIENAFVRSFAELMARGQAKERHWAQFIRQFRGPSSYDWNRVLGHLSSEYSIAKLPPKSSRFDELELQVRNYLIDEALSQGYSGKTVSDKAARDARLYAEMVHYLTQIRQRDPGATCLLVSSAHRLAQAEARFHETGEQQIVVHISVVLYMVSLLPQVSLGLSALKSFLFDEKRPGFSSDLERTVLRLVRSSREVSMPWAKRNLLTRELRDRLISDARREGRIVRNEERPWQLEQEALTEERKDRTIVLLREALDSIVVNDRGEEELARLRKENEELRRALQATKARRRK